MVLLLIVISTALPFQESEKATHANPTAQAVIDKYVEAKGGKEKLEKIKNVFLKGIVSIDGDTVGEFEIYQAANKHLTIETLPDGSIRQKHGTDSKLAWRVDAEGKPTILSGNAARDYIRHYSTLHEALEWPKHYAKIEYVEKTTIEKVVVHHLRFHTNDGSKIERYFDTESGLFVREEQTLADENKTPMISEIKNYVTDASGIKNSRLRVNHMGDEYSIEFKIVSAETNQIKDEPIFAIPDVVLKLKEKSESQK